MKLRKIVMFCFFSVLTLMAIIVRNGVGALCPGKIYSDRQHIKNFDLNHDGLVVFRWRYTNDNSEVKTVCLWIILDEGVLKNKFGLDDNQLSFFKENELKVLDIESLMGSISVKAYSYLTSYDSHFFGIENYLLLLKNWVNKSELSDSLMISGLDVYYCKNCLFGTLYGYNIKGFDKFKAWCVLRGFTDDEIKILVACQNTWMCTKRHSKIFSENILDLLPDKFKDALYAMRAKFKVCGCTSKGGAQCFLIPGTEAPINSVIDSSEDTIGCIKNQLKQLRVSQSTIDSISGLSDMCSCFKSFVSWKIDFLKKNHDIA